MCKKLRAQRLMQVAFQDRNFLKRNQKLERGSFQEILKKSKACNKYSPTDFLKASDIGAK